MTDNRINIYWAFTVFLCLLLLLFVTPEQWGNHSISDKGIFSILTITFICLAAVHLFQTTKLIGQKNIRLPLYALLYVLLIYILREADFHRLFTDEHITKDKFYTDPDISLHQKLLGGIPLAIFFICFFYLTIRYAGLLFKNVMRRNPWAVSAFLWGTTIFLSQLIDKSDLNAIYKGRAVEEMLELCAAGYMLIAIALSKKPLVNYSQTKK